MTIDRFPEPGLSIRGSAMLACMVIGAATLGVKMASDRGPGPRKEYTAGTEEVNQKVNNVLIPRIEHECLSTGRLDVEKFKQERREILGDKEADVRVLCQQVKYSSDRVFTLQLEDDARFTRDGKTYTPTGSITKNTRR